jgi:hypothetical protein
MSVSSLPSIYVFQKKKKKFIICMKMLSWQLDDILNFSLKAVVAPFHFHAW